MGCGWREGPEVRRSEGERQVRERTNILPLTRVVGPQAVYFLALRTRKLSASLDS